MKHVPGMPARSVSVMPREMGGIKTQTKIDNYFACQSARRLTKPHMYPSLASHSLNLQNPLADLKIRLAIKSGDDEPTPDPPR